MKKIVFLLFLFVAPLMSIAQPSLASNMMEDIVVTTALNERKSYSVIRDLRIENQFYYVPNAIRLSETIVAGKSARPKISILRYSFIDREKQQNKTGGLLTFAVTSAADAISIEQIQNALLKKYGKSCSVAPLPINSSKFTVLIPNTDFSNDFDADPVLGPTLANQEMSFSIPLSDLGAAVLTELLKGNAGLAIRSEIKYNGVLPPCGFMVTGSWDNVYNYMSKNTSFQASLGWSLLNIGGKVSKQKVEDELKTKFGMNVSQTSCNTKPDTVADTYLKDFISKVRDEVFTRSAIDSAKRLDKLKTALLDPKLTDQAKQALLKLITTWEVTLGVEHTVKQVSKRKTGSISVTYDKFQMVERESRVDGIISLGGYNLTDEEIKKFITEIDATGAVPVAIFGLTPIDRESGISKVLLDIKFKKPGTNQIISQARNWSPNNGWRTLNSISESRIQFNLLGVDPKIPIEDLKFDVKLAFTTNILGSITLTDVVSAYNGDGNYDLLSPLITTYKINPDLLNFNKVTNDTSGLKMVKLKIDWMDGTIMRTKNKDIVPEKVNGTFVHPNKIYFALPKKSGSPVVTITYVPFKGSNVVSTINDPSEDITLDFDN
jgi:hypothetical protein